MRANEEKDVAFLLGKRESEELTNGLSVIKRAHAPFWPMVNIVLSLPFRDLFINRCETGKKTLMVDIDRRREEQQDSYASFQAL